MRPSGGGPRATAGRGAFERTLTDHYEARHRVAAQTDALDQTTFLAYDDDGEQAARVGPGGRTWLVGYDSGGCFTESLDPRGNHEQLEWDPNNEKTESLLTVSATGVPLQSWVYDYDPAGNPISKTDLDGNVERYGYDSRGRLVRAEYPDGEAAGGGTYARFDAYRYDPVGNRIDEWREHETEGAVTHVSAGFDDANRLLSRSLDLKGDGLTVDEESYRWIALTPRRRPRCRAARAPRRTPAPDSSRRDRTRQRRSEAALR